MRRLNLSQQKDDSSYQQFNRLQSQSQSCEFKPDKPIIVTRLQNPKEIDEFIRNRGAMRKDKIFKMLQSDSENQSSNTISIQVLPQEIKKQAIILPSESGIIAEIKVDKTINESSEQVKPSKKTLSQKEEFSQALKAARQKFQKFADYKDLFIVDRKLLDDQKQVFINGTKIYFPYEAYDVQIQYMKQVLNAVENKSNAVLQSPTGTGKTLCILASVLSFVQNHYRQTKNKLKVIYMSRTHAQLKQIQKQLEKTCYRPNMAIFASRQQLCIKESLNQLKGRQKIQACGKGVKLARRLRKTQNIEQSEQDPKILQVACSFYKQREQVVAIGRSRLANTLLDIDIMRNIGFEEHFCPYFYPNHVKGFSTLFIMPYNYLLDAYLMGSYQEIVQNSIIIFDQAHNVPQAACQGRSLILETSNIETAILEMNKLLSPYLSPSLLQIKQSYQKEIKFIINMLQDYRQNFNVFVKQILPERQDNFQRESQGRDDTDIKIINKQRTDQMLFELFYGKIPDQKKRQFQSRKDFYKNQMKMKLLNPIQEFIDYGKLIIQSLKQTPDGLSLNFQRVLIFCSKVHQLLMPIVTKPTQLSWVQSQINHFRLYVSKNNLNQNMSHTVGLRCMIPWLTFTEIKKYNPRSIIMTSGTLKPLQMWSKQLQLKFNNQLVNNHVIKKQQLMTKIITTGPSDVRLNFSYDSINKNKDKIFRDLIEFIINISQRIPNGILIVFPSFRIQNDFKYELIRSSKKEKLAQFKDIMFQQKNSDLDMKQFKKRALSKKGAILAIICRGKVSEGIDFPDGMCRAVIIVGIPYPNVKDPFIIEKKNHLENIAAKSANKSDVIRGEEWYFMGTIRTINQALGRVIRHAKDYGMVFLIDSRYCESKFNKELPGWITQSMETIQKLQRSFYIEIDDFFKQMKKQFYIKEQRDQSEEKPIKKLIKPKKQSSNAFEVLMNRKKLKQKIREISNKYDF